MHYELHPLCTLFPRMGGAEFDSLVADIKTNGLSQPITLHNGFILDGGNRYRACMEAGIEPRFVEFEGASVVSFVLSANLHRRHMTAGQQAAIVASAQDWAKAHPQGQTKKHQSNQSVNETGNVTGLDTVAARRAQSGASDKTQRSADKVAKEAPDLAVKVAHGEITLPKALLQVEGRKAPVKKPEPLPEDSPVHEPTEDEIAYILAQQDSDQRAIEAILDGNGDIAALKKEYDRMAHEMATVKAQRDEYMNKCNELIRIIKSLRGKLNKLPKAA